MPASTLNILLGLFLAIFAVLTVIFLALFIHHHVENAAATATIEKTETYYMYSGVDKSGNKVLFGIDSLNDRFDTLGTGYGLVSEDVDNIGVLSEFTVDFTFGPGNVVPTKFLRPEKDFNSASVVLHPNTPSLSQKIELLLTTVDDVSGLIEDVI
jgi:hypothetical protein